MYSGEGYIACKNNGDGLGHTMLNKDYSGPTALKTKAGKDDASPITSPTCFNFTRKEEPIFGDEYSLFRSRSASLCSSDAGSVRSTGTVCESDISSRQPNLI